MKSEYAIRKRIKELKDQAAGEASDFILQGIDGHIKALEWVIAEEESEIRFDEIWAIYRTKNNSEKKKASEYWKKMDTYHQKQALEHAQAFIDYKPFESFNPPALIRYLRNERWEEVIDRLKLSPCAGHDSETDKLLREVYANK